MELIDYVNSVINSHDEPIFEKNKTEIFQSAHRLIDLVNFNYNLSEEETSKKVLRIREIAFDLIDGKYDCQKCKEAVEYLQGITDFLENNPPKPVA